MNTYFTMTTYFTPTTGDDLGQIKPVERDPHWVAKKSRKTHFATNKNTPGGKKKYVSQGGMAEPSEEPSTSGI